MRRELFVATSYHHVLTAIAKKFQGDCTMDMLVSNMSTGDEYWNPCLARLGESGWFGDIFYFDERTHRPPSPTHPLASYRYEHGGERQVIAQVAGFEPSNYDLIYLIDDKMFPGSTVVREGLPYHLCEDTANTYQLMATYGTSKVLKAPYNLICPVLKTIDYWHPVFGYGDSCIAIEASSLEGLPARLPQNKVVLVDRVALINSIPKNVKADLCDIFLGEQTMEELRACTGVTMIMTSPVSRDGDDPASMIDLAHRVLEHYAGRECVIKPHPRDVTDYATTLTGVKVLPRSFPSELLNFLDGVAIDEMVSIGSTASNSCTVAKKTSFYAVDDVYKFRNANSHE